MKNASESSDPIPVGFVPLLPLPDRVLYPGMTLTVRSTSIQHERFLEAVSDHGDWLAVATSAPGWWRLTADSLQAEVYRAVCISRVISGGTSATDRLLTFKGVGRAWIREERSEYDRRLVKVEHYAESALAVHPSQVEQQRMALLERAPRIWPAIRRVPALWGALHHDMPLGRLCDMLASAVGLDPSSQLILLNEADALTRSELLLEQLAVREHRMAAGWTDPGSELTFSRC